ncbi:MAG: tRNA 5-methoxyuridine(34)/uridine 5-oxyacetic acid(34) synthase CmoB [Candidatus Sedimenticola sp. (ex Thyasira tokunagai)]
MFQLCLSGGAQVIDYEPLYKQMRGSALESWAKQLPKQLETVFSEDRHGDFARWLNAIEQLPTWSPDKVKLDQARVAVESDSKISGEQQAQTKELLKALHPWRKGPYRLHDIDIDTEWRSDWKWDRLVPHITPLEGRTVLDVGCGNGYHCWRMAGAGAELVIGIDPTQLFLAQFLAVRHFLGEDYPVHLLPLALEQVPTNLRAFDTVFSMGVLYHRRSPIDHLYELKSCLRQGGELVLETLVIEGGEGRILVPDGRYAKMRNVWFIPSPETLCGWLRRCGFNEVRLIDVTTTSVEEQRKTEWMQFESLSDYIDPANPQLTIEGHPAPRRAIILAKSG